MSIERTHLSYLLLLAWKQSYEPQKTEAAEVYMKKTLKGTDKTTWTVLKMAVNSRGRRRAWNEYLTCKRQKKQNKRPDGGKGRGYNKQNIGTHTHTSPTAILHLFTVLSAVNDMMVGHFTIRSPNKGNRVGGVEGEGVFTCYHLTYIINKVRQIKPKCQVWTG